MSDVNAIDDPRGRAREDPIRRCAMHRMAAELTASGHTADTDGALRWVRTMELAITKGEARPCSCSPASDNAATRGHLPPRVAASAAAPTADLVGSRPHV